MIYAGFWRRFAALLIDGFFIWLISAFFMSTLIFAPIVLVLSFFYFPIFNSSVIRATPGKYLLGMAVVKPDESRIDFKTAIIRHLMGYVSSFLICFGYLMALFTDKKQTLHDYVADTVVVEGKYSDLNLWQAWLAQLKYVFNSDSAFASPESSDKRTIVVGPNTRQSLEDLYELYKKGILSEDEYKNKKEEYLRKL